MTARGSGFCAAHSWYFLTICERILPPDDAVARRDHVDGELEREDLVDLLDHAIAERREDVGVVLERLLVELFLVHLVVETERRGVVLAEGVVRHEDVVPGEVGEHAVRPVEHRRFDEDELVRADVDPVARAHLSEFPVLVVMPRDARRSPFGYDQLGVRRVPHDEGQPSRVVGLRVVGDDDVDLRRIDELADVVHELVRERPPDRVDENGLLVHDEVGVVRRAAMGAELVPVKVRRSPSRRRRPSTRLLSALRSSILPVVSRAIRFRNESLSRAPRASFR